MGRDLTNLYIDQSFQNLLQISGSKVNDGTGSLVTLLDVTSSNAITASFALNAGGAHTGSLLVTASFDNGTRDLTFTKGDASTFAVNIPDVSGSNLPPGGLNDMFLTTDGAGSASWDWVKTLHQNIRNSEATAILRGTPLFVSGATGDNANVYLADAANPARRPATLIAFDATLAPSATGTAIISGEIQGVDTSLYPAGTVVYLAAGGGWTATRPTGSATSVQSLGVITRSSNNGRGIVFNQIGNNLPNLQQGRVWVGGTGDAPTPVETGSLSVFYAVSASYATSASYEIVKEVSSSYADYAKEAGYATSSLSASYAVTASHALNAGTWDGQYTGSAIISGSLTVETLNFPGVRIVNPSNLGNYIQMAPEDGNPWTKNAFNIVAEKNFFQSPGDIFFNTNWDAGSSGSIRFITNPNGELSFSSGFIDIDSPQTSITGSVGITGSLTFKDSSTIGNLGNLVIKGADDFATPSYIEGVGSYRNATENGTKIQIGQNNINYYVTGSATARHRLWTNNNNEVLSAADSGITTRGTLNVNFFDTGSQNLRVGTNDEFFLMSISSYTGGGGPVTTTNMNFGGTDQAFFSAENDFFVKNIYAGTGSVTVWSENELTLRGNTGVVIEGDDPNTSQDTIDIKGKAFAYSIASNINGFSSEVNTLSNVRQNVRAFVETPLIIGGSGTVTVETGATLKVINEL